MGLCLMPVFQFGFVLSAADELSRFAAAYFNPSRISNIMLCSVTQGDFPAWEYQYGWVAIKRQRKHLGTLNPQVHTAILNRRNRGLRNTG